VTSNGPGVSSVEAIVLMPKGSTDRDQAIQPSTTRETTAEFKNAMGATFSGKSLTAIFPLSALSEANEVHIIYDRSIGPPARCTDCIAKLELKGVR
jgi:hypothetical protein